MAAVTIEQIDAAIATIVTTGQSVSLPNGESYTRARLSELEALRTRVRSEANTQGNGGIQFMPVSIRTGRMS